MNFDAESIRETAAAPLIPDLRGIPLGQLADRTADADDIVAGVVGRYVKEMENLSHVPVLAFNSAI
ncbi:MAG: hypothetical protein ACRDNF_19950 [Streptosporangiaceae bacterium]